MGVFRDNAITDSGRGLLAYISMGAVFVPTKIVMGSGMLPAGTTTRTIKDVVAPVQTLKINKKKRGNDGTVTIGGVYSNQEVAADFYFRELALYARADNPDGTVAAEECLYSYGNAGNTADLMPAYTSGQPVERQIDLVILVSNDAKVDLTVASGIYMTIDMAKELAAGLGGVRSFPLTIPATGWEETGETPYRYALEVPQEDAKASHIPVVCLHRDSLAAAETAGLCSGAETVDGAVRFWARHIPETDLSATLALLTPGSGELGTAGGGSAYVLPVASAETLGGVKIGKGISITEDGTISASGGGIGEDAVASDAEVGEMLEEVLGPDNTVASEEEVAEMFRDVFEGVRSDEG